jgi:hypothetical protein
MVQPWMLLGLLAAAIPIIIHLINRRRAVVRPFPAIEFLLRSQKQLARGLRLKQWILLGLRISLFILLPLALALPYAQCDPEVGAIDGRLPANVVLIVDDSASMERGAAGFETLRDAVAEELRQLRSWDEVAIVIASDQPRVVVGEFTSDHGLAQRRFNEQLLHGGSSSVDRAFASARSLHQTGRLPQRRTLWISDGSQASDTTFDSAWAEGLGSLVRIDPWDGDVDNVGVVELTAERAQTGDLSAWSIRATIVHTGSASQTQATLLVDGEVAAASNVALTAGEPAVVEFMHPIEGQGSHIVTVRVDDSAGPVADNERTTRVGTTDGGRVLVVNGDARAVQYNDEAFFLTSALDAWMPDVAGASVQTVTVDAFTSTSLEGMNAVIVANAATMEAGAVSALRRFVESGGGVLFTAGSNVVAERWNQTFGDLLPKPIRAVTRLCDADDPDVMIKATRLSGIDMRHPVFRLFRLPGGEVLQNVMVYSYVLLEPAPVDGARTLAQFGDGGPALVERRLGQGVTMMLTTSIDLDWTNLPLRSAFVPLTERLVRYLSGQSASEASGAVVGRSHELPVAGLSAQRVVLVSPSGARYVEPLGTDEVRFTPLERGRWQVSLASDDRVEEQRLEAADFIAHAPLSESELLPLPEDSWDSAVLTAAASQPSTESGSVLTAGQQSLWPWLLFGVLVVLYAESLVAVRRQLWRDLSVVRGRWMGRWAKARGR